MDEHETTTTGSPDSDGAQDDALKITVDQLLPKLGWLTRIGLDSIKSRIVALALLATLIPSLITSVISYTQNRQSLRAAISEQLISISSQAAGEVERWLGARRYDLNAFSSSFVVSGYLSGRTGRAEITNYLRSVLTLTGAHQELMLVNQRGTVVATSGDSITPVDLPDGWQEGSILRDALVSPVEWHPTLNEPVIILTRAVSNPDGGQTLGAIVSRVTFREVHETLNALKPGISGDLHLVTSDGREIAGTDGAVSELTALISSEEFADLLDIGEAVLFEDHSSETALGALWGVPRSDWAVLAELPQDEAFAAIARLRNTTMLAVLTILLGVGVLAYRLGLLIVRPLDRLAAGAAEVARGELAVDLPAAGGGEVGYLTDVFNVMVGRLRANKEKLDAANETLRDQNAELERLSITDGLTGLFNRRHMVEMLEGETKRAERTEHPFCILMLDVDHFKKFNDSFGHHAGDQVLQTVAHALREVTREVDYVARYGGEEFLVLLPETDLRTAEQVAERIRASVHEHIFLFDGQEVRVTMSVGVAEFPRNGDTSEKVVSAADSALYESKHRGRNRVTVCASPGDDAAADPQSPKALG